MEIRLNSPVSTAPESNQSVNAVKADETKRY